MADLPVLQTKERGSITAWITEKLSVLIAVTTVVLAVMATLASFKAAGYGNRMVLAQNQASDQWAYYQAKSIKETTYQVQRDMMAIAAEHFPQPESLNQKIAAYDQEIARYKKEKQEIYEEAKRLERVRDMAQAFNGMFGRALIFLQIGILFASISSINKVPYYWYIGVVSGIAGIMWFIYASYISAAF